MEPPPSSSDPKTPLHILPSSPPLLAVAPDPFSLPSYVPFEAVTWRCWETSLGSLGAGDVASVGGFEAASSGCREPSGGGDVALCAAFLTASEPVTWRPWGALLAAFGGRDVASLDAGGIDELAPDWPKGGQSPGGSTAAVAAARNGGGGEWWWW